jgi:FAD/FMN-containing dehydrogenase
MANDVGRLELHSVEVVEVEKDKNAAVRQIQELVREADRRGIPVSIAGASHSMGGHTITPDGVQLRMSGLDFMELDDRVLRVGAGATWCQVLSFLDRHGLSVWTMQSDCGFSVGDSVSVNCHGWQVNRPPIASSVLALELITPSGELLRASRDENPEMFRHVLGGYGPFAVIISVELELRDNVLYEKSIETMKTAQLSSAWKAMVQGEPAVEMAYARLDVGAEHFLASAVLTSYWPVEGVPGALEEQRLSALGRAVFRGSVGSKYGNTVRRRAEILYGLLTSGSRVSRNTLLNERSEFYQNQRGDSTDILHEYFVPPDALAAFVEDL